MSFFKVLLFLFNSVIFRVICLNIDSMQGYEERPLYGKDWIYFPDENNKLKISYTRNETIKDRSLFNVDIEKAITFTLYTKLNVDNGYTLTFDNETLKNSNFNFDKHTKFVTHGWYSSGNSSTCIQIKNNYLKYYDYNVVIVDWSPIADFAFYPAPMYDTYDVAVYYAKFITFLIPHGLNTEEIHLIGHSLGAHVSGFVGDIMGNQSIKRITGLDPAAPGFLTTLLTKGRISRNSAKFVDIIHTCGGVLGLLEPLGHADFYPNKGMPPQPGCEGISQIACSHGRSWMYFAESIHPETEFLSTKCSSVLEFVSNTCSKETAIMGDRVSTSANGTYYLKTNSKEPFAMNNVTINDV